MNDIAMKKLSLQSPSRRLQFNSLFNIPRFNQYLENRRIEKLQDHKLSLEYRISTLELFIDIEKDKCERIHSSKVFISHIIEVMMQDVVCQSRLCFEQLFRVPTNSHAALRPSISVAMAFVSHILNEMLISKMFAENGMLNLALKVYQKLRRQEQNMLWDIENCKEDLIVMSSKLDLVKEKLKDLIDYGADTVKEGKQNVSKLTRARLVRFALC